MIGSGRRLVALAALILAAMAPMASAQEARSGSDLALRVGASEPEGRQSTSIGRLMWTGVAPLGQVDMQGALMLQNDDLGTSWGASIGVFQRGEKAGAAFFLDGVRTVADNTFVQARFAGEFYLPHQRLDMSYALPFGDPKAVDLADLDDPNELCGLNGSACQSHWERAVDRFDAALAFAPSEISEVQVGVAAFDIFAIAPPNVANARGALTLSWKVEPRPGSVWTIADSEVDSEGNWTFLAGYAWGSTRLGRRTGVRPGRHAPFRVAFPQTEIYSRGGSLIAGTTTLINAPCPDDDVWTTIRGGTPPYTVQYLDPQPALWTGFETDVFFYPAPYSNVAFQAACGDDPSCRILDFFVDCPDEPDSARVLVTDAEGNCVVITLELQWL